MLRAAPESRSNSLLVEWASNPPDTFTTLAGSQRERRTTTAVPCQGHMPSQAHFVTRSPSLSGRVLRSTSRSLAPCSACSVLIAIPGLLIHHVLADPAFWAAAPQTSRTNPPHIALQPPRFPGFVNIPENDNFRIHYIIIFIIIFNMGLN